MLLLLVGAVALFCGHILPAANWQEKTVTEGDYLVELSCKKLRIYDLSEGDAHKPFYESPKELPVQDFLFSDIDRDGTKELLVILWRVGRYGTAHPFWVTEEENFYSQHLFIYNIRPDHRLKEKWCASDVGIQINRFKTMELDESTILTEDIFGECTLWRWQSWGLKSVPDDCKFIAFGDNIMHDEIRRVADTDHQGNYDFLYDDFRDEIQEADVAAIQLESVLVDNEDMVSGFPAFGAPLNLGEAIADAGFDVAVCANNHILDKGVYGIDTTVDFFEGKDIDVVGLQKSSDTEPKPYKIIYSKGIRIALFAYTYGTNVGDPSEKFPYMIHFLPGDEASREAVLSDMERARSEADVLMVFVHWGNEYEKEISPGQREMAELFAQGGADVVIGAHPHVVQPVEVVKRPDGGETIVYYSLGNFRAHQGQRAETRTGAEAVLQFEHCYEGVRLTDYKILEFDSYIG